MSIIKFEFKAWFPNSYLHSNFRIVNPNPLSMNDDVSIHLLLYDDNTYTDNTNTFLLNSVIEYITSRKRFNDPLIL